MRCAFGNNCGDVGDFIWANVESTAFLRLAGGEEVRGTVPAGRAVLARVGIALIDVDLAVETVKARRAAALVVVGRHPSGVRGREARCVIAVSVKRLLTRDTSTLVDINVAVASQ